MAKIQNLTKVLATFKSKADRSKKDDGISVSVGYTQSYAIYVHENLEAHHPVGQAKFLEQPAREMAPELGQMIGESLADGQTMGQALLQAGLALQRASQELCPVDTGALKASAFTRLDQ